MTYMSVPEWSHFMKYRIQLRWGIFGNYTFQAYKTKTDTETNVFLLGPPEVIQSCLFIIAFYILLGGATVSLLLSSPSIYPKHPSPPLLKAGGHYVHLESMVTLITGKNDSFHFKCNFRAKIIEYWN